jgi:hypothetical protein
LPGGSRGLGDVYKRQRLQLGANSTHVTLPFHTSEAAVAA